MVEHYSKNSVNVEIIDVIHDAPFTLGNLLKYMVRFGDKDDPKKQLQKIQYYRNYCMITDYFVCRKWWQQKQHWRLIQLFQDLLERKEFVIYEEYDAFITHCLDLKKSC